MRRFFSYLLLLSFFAAIGQGNCQQLFTGAVMPELRLENVLNYRNRTLDFRDLRGKPVILEFWNTRCLSCIQSFGLIDSLQQAFRNDVQFVLVNTESLDSTKMFFARRRLIRMPDVIMVTGDRMLTEYFSIASYPQSVWVDKSGVIRYKTGSYEITGEHLRSFLRGDTLGLKGSGKKLVSGTLFTLGSRALQYVGYYSYICRSVEGLEIGNTALLPSADGRSVRLSANGASIAELYKKAYGGFYQYEFDTKGSFELHCRDSFQYVRPHNPNLLDSWQEQHAYNYDLLMPASKKDSCYAIMQEDLQRYFSLKAKLVTKEAESYVLVRVPAKQALRTKGEAPLDNFRFRGKMRMADDTLKQLRNMPFTNLVSGLRNWIGYYLNMAVYDFTGYEGHIDIAIPSMYVEPLDICGLREVLQGYGLDLVERKVPRKVLILEE
ncbi:MAG TPA: TlpA disulfide reductase family protein [Chitinophagaceae bacterium]|jgi:thiol-disulfide isomerase/thioredoxin|nr:TlpA disulfide reductase family protein [Chitinophagaceae bacterium]